MNQPLSNTTKPILEIQKLIEALLPHSHLKVSPAHRKYSHYNSKGDICYLIHDGYIQLHRTLDGMVLSSVKAPMILGLSNELIPGAEDFFFTTETVTTFSELSSFDAARIVNSQGLWECMSIFQAYVMRHLTVLNTKLTALTAYEMTRNQLINLMNEPEQIRENITAVRYIQEHTKLSRSGIMRMLAHLKEGNYIKLDKGCLVQIKNIPLKF
jgi:hypothetical protein